MTGSQDCGRPAAADCVVLPGSAVAAYAGGGLGTAAAWSVEAHLPGCEACRAVLAGFSPAARLERNRSVLMTMAALPAPSCFGRALRRCGVPEHIGVLLAVTPSLRRSWLAGVLLVLAAAVGAAQLAPVGPATRSLALLGDQSGWAGLLPFLLLAPMLPLAAVAAAFSARIDPAYDLASAAPVSKVWLLCVRSVAVISATLVPTMLAALALPGPWWLSAALLLPALALCAAALAAATVTTPLLGAIGAGAAWTAAIAAVGLTAGNPELVIGPAGQLTALAILMGAVTLIAARRNQFDIGWMG